MLKKHGTGRYFLSCMHSEKQKVAMTLTGKISTIILLNIPLKAANYV